MSAQCSNSGHVTWETLSPHLSRLSVVESEVRELRARSSAFRTAVLSAAVSLPFGVAGSVIGFLALQMLGGQ